jgi:protein tyrosine phosphatase (PTP) superfamily phosphohydrolase (DUF442 family)
LEPDVICLSSHTGRPGSEAFWGILLATVLLLLAPFVGPPLVAHEPPQATLAQPAKPQDDLPGLTNFAKISDALYRGAQPTAEGFATLKAHGIKTIVNLRLEHSDRSLLAGIGLQYVEIRCNPLDPEEKQVVEFLRVVRDSKNQPVFVHCAYGSDRTGTMVGIYRITQQGWSADETIKELYVFGYHPIYTQILPFLKSFDPATIGGKVDAAPAPKVEVVK